MKSRLKLYISICLIFCTISLYADDWIIGAQVFSTNKSKSQVYNVLGETLPSLILEDLGNSMNREVTPDEKYERKKYQLEKDRLSLFLQLSAEYKKRDSLVLGDYTPKQLAKQQKAADEKIREIEKKIQENINSQNEEKLLAQKNQQLVDEGKIKTSGEINEGKKWLYMFRNMFSKDSELISQESIRFYKNDTSSLFKPSDKAASAGISSYEFQQEAVNAKINTLLTGKITSYGEYLSVTVEAYLFPGCKQIASVMEVGSIRDVEFIASNIAGKLTSYITNALPVELEIIIKPEDSINPKVYIDAKLQNIDSKILLYSGIRNIEVSAEGYKSISTTYNFQGNRKYVAEIQMEPEINSFIYMKTRSKEELSLFADGKSVERLDDGVSKIKINGQTILGQFVNTDGLSGFYYIPEKNQQPEKTLKVTAKVRDTSKYIDTRRHWMYGAYSALMVSLIPYNICVGEFQNRVNAYTAVPSIDTYNDAKNWMTAANISQYVSIGCGVFFGYELIRYLIAANSVLPKKAEKTDIIYVENQFENILETSVETGTAEETENTEQTETEE